MAYEILNEDTICEYLLGIESVREYFSGDALVASEIGDGNLNFVFIVKSLDDDTKALIVKQAVPYLRCVGDSFPLSRKRMSFEIRALQSYYDATPSYTPKIYEANEAMSLVVMEYLGTHIIMRQGLIDRVVYPQFAEHISEFLAENLFKTSSLSLQSSAKRELIDQFNSNRELCKLTEDFVFTFGFMPHETNDDNADDNETAQSLFDDMEFKKQVLKLKYKFMNQTDALLHGDLHTGSIMLNADETYVIDPEFAFVGPFGFDIGAVIGNLVLSYVSHFYRSGDEKYQGYLLALIQTIWNDFEKKFLLLWDAQKNSSLIIEGYIDDATRQEYQSEFMRGILQDTVGFAGCKMARRIYGIAGVEDIRGIEDKQMRRSAEKHAVEIAKRFVKEYQSVESVEDMMLLIGASGV